MRENHEKLVKNAEAREKARKQAETQTICRYL